MEKTYEDIYKVQEKTHPWFVFRRKLFYNFIKNKKSASILDIGCSSAIFLKYLKKQGFANLEGLEPSENLRKEGHLDITIHKKLPAKKYDVIFLLDVLEHIEDDEQMLKDIKNALKEHGTFYISVPAHPFLWSHHDVVNHHYRRYTKNELKEKLRRAGFKIKRLTYWNMFAFFPMALLRIFKRNSKSSAIENNSKIVLAVYGVILAIENQLIKFFNLPIGVSIIGVLKNE